MERSKLDRPKVDVTYATPGEISELLTLIQANWQEAAIMGGNDEEYPILFNIRERLLQSDKITAKEFGRFKKQVYEVLNKERE